ncbi:phage major tail tube protein [Sulfurihydrogenibium sp.]|jgi:P2 family phage contractile tail tube protein|uniref:phage major tail tube protein n=1 Tax=Sulfurihydrogenibium sp. TaxID=2053621 RepID=UPI00260656B9|nr:phage major tail tube protein [Sulfurihydrogenibium sp.]
MAIEIAKVFNARVYIDGTDFIAKAEEVELPKLKFTFADTKALGLYGASELPTGIDKMEAKIRFNSTYPDFLSIASDPFTSRTVIVRAPYQVWTQQGVAKTSSLKAEIRGFFKEFDSGKFKRGDSAESEATLSVLYFKLEIDGQEIVEVDTLNNIYKVNGQDKLQDYRTAIGG